ncbi:YrhB domain-containing protein [Bradyrhizobium murdochi]|uniref:YrhB domain-containing protein n=1 Tax=Bradyrhizobium murdochi TaxID=1038859 RepID=UPI00054DC071|nr:YrhB domain-containing protein [Bradyrhizobium murdochi]
MTISFDQAKDLAERTVRGLADASNDEFDIIRNEAIDEGWLFFYDTKEFAETGNFSSRLAGNGPIFVDRSGVVKIISSATPWQVAIRSL